MPYTQSQQITDMQAFQSYVLEHYQALITRLFYSFMSAGYCTPHEGMKGKKTLTNLVIDKLVRRYGKDFTVIANTHKYGQRVLDVYSAKVDMRIYPKDFESTYLGMMRSKGQNGNMSIVFEQELMNATFEKIAEEMELAFWRANKAAVDKPSDTLDMLYDGVIEILKAEVANLQPVTTGVLTESNAFTQIQRVYKSVSNKFKAKGIELFISPTTDYLAGVEYANLYTKYAGKNGEGFFLKSNVSTVLLPGVPDNAIIFMPKENIHYGYDGAFDASFFQMEQEDRSIKFWCDFNMGVQLGIAHHDFITCNEQTLI